MTRLNKSIYPEYKKYPVKVLQFGEGNFLRAFVNWQLDVLNKKAGFNGSAAVIQPLPQSFVVDALNEQDGLFTLYLQGIKDGKPVREHSIINSIDASINPFTDYEAYLNLAKGEDLRFIVSNTTEAGIAYDPADKLEDRPPNSYPAKLTVFLYKRYIHFKGDKSMGFIIIPCELIDRNGDKLKKIVLQYAELWGLGQDFKEWLHEANTFCCSLVDRIVPGYPKDDIDRITAELGYEDKVVDVGEQFHLWVIEGPQWIANEFPVQKAGLNVKIVDDMTPYRTRKVRILNGAHTTLVPAAYLLGLETVGQAVNDKVAGSFLRNAVYEEIIPTLDLPQAELEEFAKAVLERFENPFVNHYLMSIALNSFSKYETRVLPSLLEYQKRKGVLPARLAFSLAALLEFYKGKRSGEEIQLNDEPEVLELMGKLWTAADGSEGSLRQLVTEVLAFEHVWKQDLNNVQGLTDAVTAYLADIEKHGIQQAIQQVL